MKTYTNEDEFDGCPEFLMKGIFNEDEVIYPLSLIITAETMSTNRHYLKRKKGLEVLKAILKEKKFQDESYMKNKTSILEMEFLKKQRFQLSFQDFEKLITSIEAFPIGNMEKIRITKSLNEIKKYVDQRQFFADAISNVKLYYGI